MNYDRVYKLALEKGFFAPSCEIYSDAPAGFWEYGPLGTVLRNKFIDLWRREMIRRDSMIEIDGSQIMDKGVFQASGHLESFGDPIAKCRDCKAYLRIDKVINENTGMNIPERLSLTEYDDLVSEREIKCTSCGGILEKTHTFQMMFKIGTGPSSDEAYLRPETCQSIFVDFPRLFRIMRKRLPLGIAQFGKSFRNEISPRQSLLRLREFYQAEIEVFFNPMKIDQINKFDDVANEIIPITLVGGRHEKITLNEASSREILPNKLIAYYLWLLYQFYERTGIDMSRVRFRELAEKDRAFYATHAFDFEVETSLGWIELVACNYRSDYDLSSHSKSSNQDLRISEEDNVKFIPHIFELSMGVDRSIYCILEHGLIRDGERDVLKLKSWLSPIQVGILPLVNKDDISNRALQLHEELKMDFNTIYDGSGSIGRRYRRLDEIGSPVCITIDYQTLEDDTVTIRDRDSMTQIRKPISNIKEVLEGIISIPDFNNK